MSTCQHATEYIVTCMNCRNIRIEHLAKQREAVIEQIKKALLQIEELNSVDLIHERGCFWGWETDDLTTAHMIVFSGRPMHLLCTEEKTSSVRRVPPMMIAKKCHLCQRMVEDSVTAEIVAANGT